MSGPLPHRSGNTSRATHARDHEHGHGHGHDHHAPTVTAGNAGRIRFVLILTAGYAMVQAVGGWIAGSLALIADAGHMVSDAAALALALMAYRIAARPPDARRSYGFHRVRVLAALANGTGLLLLVAWIVWEAVARFRQPVEVLAGPMLVVAAIGLLVNLVGAWVLSRGDRNDANLHGAFLHVVGDLLGSVGAIGAAIGIMLTGWMMLDPILSVLVALLVVRSAWKLVRQSTAVLLQSVPAHIDPDAVRADIAALPGIESARHLHVWTLTDDSVIATVHVTPSDGSDPLDLPRAVAALMREHHHIDHVTVQVDRRGSLDAAPH
ncbi:MAG: cation diffusion facilitator family transporter [Pseudoxanthomonas suwonensis]|nr:cation diffusion facilitator family transporter [Pseudoxanthomonas suwonensis]